MACKNQPAPSKPDWKSLADEWEYPEPITNFELTDQNGKPFSLDRFTDAYVLIGFVFSRCPMPEACPLTMKRMRQVQQAFQEAQNAGLAAGKKLELLTITLDPEFDTPDILKKDLKA